MPRVGIQVAGASYQVKNIMWTLYKANKSMYQQNHFAEAKFKTLVEERVLGVGRYFALDEASTTSNGNITVSRARGDRVDGVPSTILAKEASSNHSWPSPSLSAGPKPPITFTMEFLPSGQSFPPHFVFTVIQKLLIDIAEFDVAASNPGLVYYTTKGNFYILVRATSQASVENLKNYIIVFSLQALAGGLADDRPGGRWQEFKGLIKWYGKIVGIVTMRAGRSQEGSAGGKEKGEGEVGEVASA